MSKDIQFEELFEQLDQAIEPLKKAEANIQENEYLCTSHLELEFFFHQ